MRKKAYVASLLLLPALLLLLASTGEQPKGLSKVEIKTAHYDLYCEGPNAEEYGELLEQAYSQFQDFFGATPQWRLRVKVLDGSGSYSNAMQAAGLDHPAERAVRTGGLYLNTFDIAFVKRNPSAWETKAAIIHEATHQFHQQARTKSQAMPSSAYYTEGLAKYFDQRHWDGRTLHVDVIRETLAIDIFQRTLDRFRSHRKSVLRNIVIDTGYFDQVHLGVHDYDEAYLFVRFLIEQHPAEFRALAARLDQMGDPGTAWDEVFGASPVDVNEEFATWLEQRVRKSPYVPWSGYWRRAGDWIEGSPFEEKDGGGNRFIGLMELKDLANPISLQVRTTQPDSEAGLFFDEPDKVTRYVFLTSDGRIKSQSRTPAGEWAGKTVGKMEKSPQPWRLDVRRIDNRWVVEVQGGTEIAIESPADAKVGLAVIGRAEFKIGP